MNKLTRIEREQLNRQDDIISKAEELFCEQGFAKASMDDLARRSEYTKRTIYRYFTNKEDLLFAVALRGYKRLWEMIQIKSQKADTGIEKIHLAYYEYYTFFCNYPNLMQLMNGANNIKSTDDGQELPYHQHFMAFDKHMFEGLLQMFLDGKADGSIRADLDISYLAFSSIFTAVGFFNMLSMFGNTYTKHFQLDRDLFVKFTIERLVDSLRHTNSIKLIN